MIQRVGTVAPRVYSYIRFSTPEQALGDSERRQIEAARAWAARNSYTLDETLKDDGLSGYHGAHRKRKDGKLGQFLANVEAGRIPHGSILLVENIDRLSRESVDDVLREIVFKLWDFGITLVTLSPEGTFPPGSANGPAFIALFIYMQLAREESAKKSLRIRAARERARTQARVEGRPLTRMCPAWLRVSDDGRSFQIIEEAADAVRLIYAMRLQGLGTRSIERALNKSAPWTPQDNPVRRRRPGNGWRASYIKKILQNPAVIGVYQPYGQGSDGRRPIGEPIADYYPAVLDRDTYYAVKNLMSANAGKGGRTGLAKNLFVHLAKCAYCGGSMHYVDKGKPPKGRKYLECDNARRRLRCEWHRISYDEIEQLVIESCPGLRPEQVLPGADEAAMRSLATRNRLHAVAGELDAIEQQLTNLADQIATTPSKAARDRYETKLVDLETRKADLESQRERDQLELNTLENAGRTLEVWQASITELRVALADGDANVRLRLRAHLREFIACIEVFAAGYRRLYNGREDGDWLDTECLAYELEEKVYAVNPAFTRRKDFRSFLEHLTQRRMSKDGRFIRIRFHTGRSIDLAPNGSLANVVGRIEATSDAWTYGSPALTAVWNEFRENF